MAVHQLHIVALPYHEVGNCLDDFYAEAKGRSVTLRHDASNAVDRNAVMAFDWSGRHIGYVQSNECAIALEILGQGGKKNLRAHIAEVNALHNRLTVEVVSEWDGKLFDMPRNAELDKWQYTGPLMQPTKNMVKLDFMTEELMERLNDMELWEKGDKEDYAEMIERFCAITKLDISAEMHDYRKKLKERLEDKGLYEMAEKIGAEDGHAGRESKDGEVKDYWINLLTKQEKSSHLYAEREKHSVADVESQLINFPGNLYGTWVYSQEHFVARAYYMHIPKRILWEFLSGIAFVEMMRRNDAQGYSHDTNAITVQEIVDYCRNKPEWGDVKDIVAMLNTILRNKGTEKEIKLVDSIEENFRNRHSGNIYNAPVGQVLEHVNKVEKYG